MKIKLLLLTGIIMVVACKKSTDNNNPGTCTLSQTSLVGKWAFSAATYKLTSTSTPVDIYHNTDWFDACNIDDYTQFNANLTYNYVDAGTTCSPSGSLSGTWIIRNDTIYTTNTYGTAPNFVSSFDCKTMVITYKDYDTPGDEATITYKLIN